MGCFIQHKAEIKNSIAVFLNSFLLSLMGTQLIGASKLTDWTVAASIIRSSNPKVESSVSKRAIPLPSLPITQNGLLNIMLNTVP